GASFTRIVYAALARLANQKQRNSKSQARDKIESANFKSARRLRWNADVEIKGPISSRTPPRPPRLRPVALVHTRACAPDTFWPADRPDKIPGTVKTGSSPQ